MKSLIKHTLENIRANSIESSEYMDAKAHMELLLAARSRSYELPRLSKDEQARQRARNATDEYLIQWEKDYASLTDGEIRFVQKTIDDKFGLGSAKRLYYKAQTGNLDGVIDCVKHGAGKYAKNYFALAAASEFGHVEVVRYLLKQDENVRINEGCALQYAIEQGHLEIVKLLVEHNVHINIGEGWDDQLGIRLFFTKDKDTDIRVGNDWPLGIAANYHQYEICEYLIKQGMDCQRLVEGGKLSEEVIHGLNKCNTKVKLEKETAEKSITKSARTKI